MTQNTQNQSLDLSNLLDDPKRLMTMIILVVAALALMSFYAFIINRRPNGLTFFIIFSIINTILIYKFRKISHSAQSAESKKDIGKENEKVKVDS